MNRDLRCFSGVIAIGVMGLPVAAWAGGTPLTSLQVASGLTQPLALAGAPGDPNRLYVAERTGRIRIINLQNNTVLATSFLDISALVRTDWLEWGLLGLCFDPDYANNGYFYVHYSDLPSANCVIARYTRMAGNPDQADPASRTVVLYLVQPNQNHRGGWLGFDPTGFLRITFGDGGGQNDPSNRAQNTNDLHGKILRVDPTGDDFPADPNKNYRIPPDNPFITNPSVLDEIWDYGLRNPWRASFDRATGDFWIGDVGQNQREEIDFEPAGFLGGRNYGWRCTEGTFCTGLSGCTCNGPTLTPPIFEYNHAVGLSITGGYVYRGCAIPDLVGTYFYADYQFNKIFSLRYNGVAVSEQQERTAELDPAGPLNVQGVAAFGEDADGEIYMCDYNGGEVFKIVPNGVPPEPCVLLGDMNCDGIVSISDIGAFVLALTDPAGYASAFPGCNINNADLNHDDQVSVGDIGAFVALLTGG